MSVIPLSDSPQSQVQSLLAAICRNESKLLPVQVRLATNCRKILWRAGPENDNSCSVSWPVGVDVLITRLLQLKYLMYFR